MRLLTTYPNFNLSLETGEKYYCVPSDYATYGSLGVKYLGDLDDIYDTTGYYNSGSYPSRRLDTLAVTDSFYRIMESSGNYRSIWGTTGSSVPGASVTIIKNIYFSEAKTVIVMIIADNHFRIFLNNILQVQTISDPLPVPMPSDSTTMFTWINSFPIQVSAGYNLFKFVGIQGQSALYNSLGVLILGNSATSLFGPNYMSNDFTYLSESSWDVVYTSDKAITEGVYFNYGTTIISLANYLGVTPITNAPPSSISSWTINWGDSSTESGTLLIDLTHKYLSIGTYSIIFYMLLITGQTLTFTKNITVT